MWIGINAVSWCYSYRSAVRGSRRIARCARRKQAAKATAANRTETATTSRAQWRLHQIVPGRAVWLTRRPTPLPSFFFRSTPRSRRARMAMFTRRVPPRAFLAANPELHSFTSPRPAFSLAFSLTRISGPPSDRSAKRGALAKRRLERTLLESRYRPRREYSGLSA